MLIFVLQKAIIKYRIPMKKIIFVFLCLGLFVAILVFRSPTKAPGGRIWIKLQDEVFLYKPDDFVRGFIMIDSNNQPINDFNIAFTYDSTSLQLITFENLEPSLQAVIKSEKGKVVLTGTKKSSVNGPLILKETPLVMFSFKASKLGNSYLGLQFSSNKIKGETIFIGQTITAVKNQTIILPGTNLKLKLQSIEKPSLNCRDCLTLVTLEVEDNGKTEDLVFKSGGIAGVLVNQINAFGYTFKLDSFGENEVNLIYYKI